MAVANRKYSDHDAAAEMEGHMLFVAERIGSDWKKLARKLKIKNRVIDNIDKEIKEGSEEKAIQALLKWSRAQSQTIATIEILIKTLHGIGETPIAEELGMKIGWQPKAERKHNLLRPISENLEHQTRTGESSKPAVHRAVVSESPIKIFDTELKAMLKDCTDNLNTGGRSTLVHDIKMVKHVQKLNTVLQKLVDSGQYSNDDGAAVEEIKRSCRARHEQADQTMRLLLQISADPSMTNKVPLDPKRKKGKINKTRPASEILPRCTSEVNLQKRSNTYSSPPNKSDISSPISTSKPNSLLNIEPTLLQPKHDRISEEQPRETEHTEVSTKVHQSVARCESCGGPCMSNLQAAAPDSAGSACSEHEQASLDENRNQARSYLTMQPDQEVSEEETEQYILV